MRGKTAEIRIYEHLQPGITYKIVLNKYLCDILGTNLANPVALAFSSGATTDTGSISGKVYNYNLTPATEALLLAYSVGSQKTDPDYLTQTGPDGSFRIEHLAAGQYRIFAVNDRDHDMRFNPSREPAAVPDRPSIASGTSSILLRFAADEHSQSGQTPSVTDRMNDQPGMLTGSCRANAGALTVEALRQGDNVSFLTTADRVGKGLFRYTFPSLPPGTYTVSASIPAKPGNNKPPKAWKPGRLEPFAPSDAFGVYADTVRIRPGWITDAIDFAVSP